MPAYFGPVLTNAPSIEKFVADYATNRFSAAKVVAGWGLDGGWTEEARGILLRYVPNLIVRSVSGDPSYRGWGESWFPRPEQLVEEFRPWVEQRPNVWLEVGNEPDVVWERPEWGGDKDEETIWVYRWWLERSLKRLREEFPLARIIGPSPRVGTPNWIRWLEIPKDVLSRFDSVSVHIYGWHRLFGDGKGEFEAALPIYRRLFPHKSVAVTELGINNPEMPASLKLAYYRDFARNAPLNWTWALAYHYDSRREFHQEYSLFPSS